ncbi:unnamed protein product [Pleuronectes platessa]|uniref:Uncharacterized protein n=1 Tax=Pleuronectes platessa TaxID=8262 RepID=A0A9N7UUA6_PLEPL|nr:unnamed protein product [Pleuronectes platessa]
MRRCVNEPAQQQQPDGEGKLVVCRRSLWDNTSESSCGHMQALRAAARGHAARELRLKSNSHRDTEQQQRGSTPRLRREDNQLKTAGGAEEEDSPLRRSCGADAPAGGGGGGGGFPRAGVCAAALELEQPVEELPEPGRVALQHRWLWLHGAHLKVMMLGP